MGSTSNEAQFVGLSNLQDVFGPFGVVDTRTLLAREVGPVGLKRTVVQSGFTIWHGVLHNHVSIDRLSKESR